MPVNLVLSKITCRKLVSNKDLGLFAFSGKFKKAHLPLNLRALKPVLGVHTFKSCLGKLSLKFKVCL